MILDTNALSAFADGNVAVGDILRQQPQVAVPVIVLEFRYGIAGSRHRKSYEVWLGDHLRDFTLLPDSLYVLRPLHAPSSLQHFPQIRPSLG